MTQSRSIEVIIASEINAQPRQIAATIELIDEGATIPFIARYRKERTGGLDDTQLRTLSDRLTYLRDLNTRRDAVLKSIKEQDKLTKPLEAQILAVETKVELEDLYAPYKQKRRTKATTAKDAGLEPLADKLMLNPAQSPEQMAQAFIDPSKGVQDLTAALEGARDILVERIAETPAVVSKVRERVWSGGSLSSNLVKGKESDGAKFKDYFDFDEPISEMPSHRALALLRGQKEGVLKINLDLPHDKARPHPAIGMIMREVGVSNKGRQGDAWLSDTVAQSWKSKLSKSTANDSFSRLRERAETDAIKVFSRNLKDLLLAAPAGPKIVMGIDPGIRTGCKVAIVDATGKLLATTTIYPHEPRNDWRGALSTLTDLVKKHKVDLICIGNGTASRETDKLVGELKTSPTPPRIIVSEAGASVYSASELAAKEFPDLDVSLRGAVSIARRLQDPLAELVKIEPKAIGVGQYQHDVDQTALARSLDATVEDCVNAVGVDVNTASAALLARVSGLNATLAANIVAYRDANGPFKTRTALKKVPRMGPKAYEQSAGFLRILGAKNPLDRSAVHPEAYEVVENIARKTSRNIAGIIGDRAFLSRLNPKDYVSDTFGLPTVTDIISELEKPGRDPRPDFKTAAFKDGVEAIGDLAPGMILEGVITNVTAFGAFVDIGVHQDGLVHISEMADTFVKDPQDVVRTGQVVSVRVLDVDASRKRISLSMKSQNNGGQRTRHAS